MGGWWVLLGGLALGFNGCKQQRTVCDQPSYFRAPSQPSGSPAPSLADLPKGPDVSPNDLATTVTGIVFKDPTHITVWIGTYDVHAATPMIFSSGEEKARVAGAPDEAYRMARLSDDHQDRVRFAFRSAICVDVNGQARDSQCGTYGNDVDLIAEMTCRIEAEP